MTFIGPDLPRRHRGEQQHRLGGLRDAAPGQGHGEDRGHPGSGATRLRPVLLTAMTTVIGLIPLTFGINVDFVGLVTDLSPNFAIGSENTQFWGPMGTTIISGLTFATFLTLVIVPVLYSVFDSLGRAPRRPPSRSARRTPTAAPGAPGGGEADVGRAPGPHLRRRRRRHARSCAPPTPSRSARGLGRTRRGASALPSGSLSRATGRPRPPDAMFALRPHRSSNAPRARRHRSTARSSWTR